MIATAISRHRIFIRGRRMPVPSAPIRADGYLGLAEVLLRF